MYYTPTVAVRHVAITVGDFDDGSNEFNNNNNT